MGYENIYLLAKSVEDVQLTPLSVTLVVLVRFIFQNFRIEADLYIAIAAITVYDEMLGGLQWLF